MVFGHGARLRGGHLADVGAGRLDLRRLVCCGLDLGRSRRAPRRRVRARGGRAAGLVTSSSVTSRWVSSSATAARCAASHSAAVVRCSGSASSAWRAASSALARSAADRVPAVWASQRERASSSSLELGGACFEGRGERRGLLRFGAEAGLLVGVGGGVGLGAAELRVVPGSGRGLVGAGELVGDVAGRPGGFALVGADADAELAVGQLELLAVDLGAAEGAPGGAVGGVGLDLARPGCRAEGVLGVVVAAAARARRRRRSARSCHWSRSASDSGTGPEGVGEPARRLGGELLAELGAASVGGVGEGGRGSGPSRRGRWSGSSRPRCGRRGRRCGRRGCGRG